MAKQRPPRQNSGWSCLVFALLALLAPACTTAPSQPPLASPSGEPGDVQAPGPRGAALTGRGPSAGAAASAGLASARQLIKIAGHGDTLSAVALTPDGHWALTGSADLTVRLWDLRRGNGKGEQVQLLSGHSQPVTAVAVSADGKMAMSSALDRTVRVWDLASGKALRAWRSRSRYIGALAFAPSGQLAASGSHDGQVMVWDLKTGKLAAAFRAHQRPINEVSFSQDGSQLLTASDDRTAVLWDWSKSMVRMRFVGHTGWVTSAVLSHGGDQVLSGSADRSVRLWDVASGRELHAYQGSAGLISRVTFAHAGKLVVAGGGALGPGGDMGPQDFTVRVWDLNTGTELRQLVGHGGPVAALMPAGDSQLQSASLDETVRLWDLPPPGLIAVAPSGR